MRKRRRDRARWAAAAVALTLAGCVAPAAVSVTGPAPGVPAPGVPAAGAPESASASATAPRVAKVPTARDQQGLDAAASSAPQLAAWREGSGVTGVDVSRYQESVDWASLAASGHAFAYVKATEGTSHRSPTHDEQRSAARAAGLLQGAYHYARPAQSSGTLQARFFHANGGGWTPDGVTLPGAVDLEFAESGPPCHGLTRSAMVTWLTDFSDEYLRLSGRLPVIYTRAEVWDACTGGDRSFAEHPLWLYDHGPLPGTLPRGWERPTLWQRGVEDGLDRNVFFGSREQLVAWASGPVR